jgi:hypothetical protein
MLVRSHSDAFNVTVYHARCGIIATRVLVVGFFCDLVRFLPGFTCVGRILFCLPGSLPATRDQESEILNDIGWSQGATGLLTE